MNELFQRFLCLAEEARLPEGEYLSVCNSLKEAFEVKKARDESPVVITVRSEGADIPFTLTLHKTTTDDYLLNATIGDSSVKNKRVERYHTKDILFHLFVNTNVRKIQVDSLYKATYCSGPSITAAKIASIVENGSEWEFCRIHEWMQIAAENISGHLE